MNKDPLLYRFLGNGDSSELLTSGITCSDVIHWMSSEDMEVLSFVYFLLNGKIFGGFEDKGISRKTINSFKIQFWCKCLEEDVAPCYTGWRLSRFEAANEVFDFLVKNINIEIKEAIAEQNSVIEMLLELTKEDEAIARCWQVTIADRLPRIRRGRSALKKVLERFAFLIK